jgi:hypothetical protein
MGWMQMVLVTWNVDREVQYLEKTSIGSHSILHLTLTAGTLTSAALMKFTTAWLIQVG